jgi:RNA polymerase sigma-70 factor (ECF subfamily)
MLGERELTTVFETHRAAIAAYVTRFIDDAVEAEDLTQEGFVRAHAAREAFRGDSKPSTWLYSIATNVCLDYLKSARHRRQQLVPPDAAAGLAADEQEGPRLSASLLLDQAEMGACVRQFIEELPPDHRLALLLHDIEGMPNPRIAEALGCSVATVKIRVHRARNRLRETLRRNCSFECDERGVFVCEPKPPTEPDS